MLDTIRIFATVCLPESVVDSVFSNVEDHASRKTGETYWTGILRGMRAEIHPSHVILDGSLAKFGQGHNLFGMGFAGDVHSIRETCELLHIDPSDTQARRTDFGTSLLISRPPCEALSLFGERARFVRTTLNDNIVTYSQAQHRFKGYDKIKEMKRAVQSGKLDPAKLPSGWEDMNAIRLESTLVRNKKRLLGLPTDGRCISLEDFCNPNIYEAMVTVWAADYFAVEKRRIVRMQGKPVLSGTQEMKEYLEWLGFRAEGEERLRAGIRACSDKKKRQRMSTKLKEIAKRSPYEEGSTLIEELDLKVKEAVELTLSTIR